MPAKAPGPGPMGPWGPCFTMFYPIPIPSLGPINLIRPPYQPTLTPYQPTLAPGMPIGYFKGPVYRVADGQFRNSWSKGCKGTLRVL